MVLRVERAREVGKRGGQKSGYLWYRANRKQKVLVHSEILSILIENFKNRVYHVDNLHFVLYLSIYIALLTAWAFQKRSRLQHRYRVGVNTSKQCRQLWVKDLPNLGPYVAARGGFEPAILRTKGTEPTTEPHLHCTTIERTSQSSVQSSLSSVSRKFSITTESQAHIKFSRQFSMLLETFASSLI